MLPGLIVRGQPENVFIDDINIVSPSQDPKSARANMTRRSLNAARAGALKVTTADFSVHVAWNH